MTLKDESPRLVGAQNATGEEWRNNSRKNEEMEPKQKQHPVVDMTGDGSKVRCCKEQYCTGTWGDSPDKNTGVDCHFLLQCMKVESESEVTQSCPT